jgi:hypothetical protein
MSAAALPAGLVVHDLAAATNAADVVAPSLVRRSDDSFLVYRERVTWLNGDPGCGKSWVADAAVLELITNGGSAAVLDYESSPTVAARRLADLGATEDDLHRVVYVQPVGPIDELAGAWLQELVTDRGIALVVVDSCAEALAAEGIDENEAGPVTAWISRLPRALARSGAAVVVIDHLTKASDGRGRWARGSSAKLAAQDAGFTLVTRRPFSRNHSGEADLIVAKDRSGYLGATGETAANVKFDVYRGSLHRVVFDMPSADTGTGSPDDVAAIVSALHGGSASLRDITAETGIPTRRVARALVALRDERVVEETAGPRGGARWRLTTPAGGTAS